MKRIYKILLASSLMLSFGLTTLGMTHVQAQTTTPKAIQFIRKAPTNSDIVVPTTTRQSTEQALANRARNSWSWYVVRASGITAAVSLVLLMLSGIGAVTGFTFSFLEPITAWATHRALGITFGVSVLLHMFLLIFDKFVPFKLSEILVPFLSKYQPVTLFGFHLGSFWVALGVVSFYLTAAVVISSLLWVDKHPKLWRLTHFLSYLILAFVFVHALYLGTDLAHGVLRWSWIGFGVLTAWAVVHRLWRARTI